MIPIKYGHLEFVSHLNMQRFVLEYVVAWLKSYSTQYTWEENNV